MYHTNHTNHLNNNIACKFSLIRAWAQVEGSGCSLALQMVTGTKSGPPGKPGSKTGYNVLKTKLERKTKELEEKEKALGEKTNELEKVKKELEEKKEALGDFWNELEKVKKEPQPASQP